MRVSEQSTGEKGGQGLRVGVICRNSALADSWLEGLGAGLARGQQSLVTIFGTISMPGAGMFFGGTQQPRCKFKEQGVTAVQGRGPTRRGPWERSQEMGRSGSE